MARLAYFAPGVYVEEVASARQPIAGVGTSTAGFIGLVPDTIYIPVANPEYDPTLTRELLDFARLKAEPQRKDQTAEKKREDDIAKLKKDLRARLDSIHREIDKLEAAKPNLDQAVAKAKKAVDDQDALPPLPDGAPGQVVSQRSTERNNAQKALTKAERELALHDDAHEKKQKDFKNIEDEFKAAEQLTAGAVPAPAGAAPSNSPAAKSDLEEEDILYESKESVDPALLIPSILRPYYLVRHDVKAAEFATKLCTNFTEYTNLFGDFSAFEMIDGTARPLCPGHHMLTHALHGFFNNGGTKAFVARVSRVEFLDKALERFKSIEDVAILAAPGLPKIADVWGPLETYCEDAAHQNVFAILDSPGVVNDGTSNEFEVRKLGFDSLDNVLPERSSHAAYYFPYLEVSDPAKRLQDNDPAWGVAPKYRGRTYVAPSGHMAGIYARTDEERGVHKAPANTRVRGALEVKYYVSKPKQELLNPQGVNCIRLINGDVTVWGARTIGGDFNGDSKYISVRRFLGFLEASIDRGTQWVVFEPNDPRLWSKIILNVTAFLTNVWRGGALFGLTQQEAFYVKCDAELNPPEVRDLGQVITEIGVSIVRPAEFVIFRISQSSGQQQG